ncbi:MAG: hypothetical protein K940chlam2_00826 [Chlamydiae bacterium]|nr:hypothetical protein [Chlamydiota bacterium]
MKRYKIVLLILALPLFFGVERFCRWQTGGFRPSKVTCHLPHTFHHPVAPISPGLIEEINKTLEEPFTFLGRGVQCYAFVSQDGTTVLKLFKHHHFGLPSDLLNFLPLKWAQNVIQKRNQRLHHIYKSAVIASTRLKEESGTLYLHLEKTPGLHPLVTVHDKLKSAYPLDLNDCEFVLQKRARPAREVINEQLVRGSVDGALRSIFALLKLTRLQSELGIKNKDPQVLDNCGFCDSKPLLIDIGSLKMRSRSTNPDPTGKAIFKAKRQILHWIEKKHPSQLSHIEEALNEKDT